MLLASLAGCSAPLPVPEAGFSDAERDAAIARDLQSLWESNFPDEPRPEVEMVKLASVEDWPYLFSECMRAAGWDYRMDAEGGMSVSFDVDDDASVGSPFSRDTYECSARYPHDPETSGAYNGAQRAYLWDYYGRWLVPCLEAAGYHTSEAPTRQEYIDGEGGWGWWSPYSSILMPEQPAESSELIERCAPLPPALRPGALGAEGE